MCTFDTCLLVIHDSTLQQHKSTAARLSYRLCQCIILTSLCDVLHFLHVALYAGDVGKKCSLHMPKMLTFVYMLHG